MTTDAESELERAVRGVAGDVCSQLGLEPVQLTIGRAKRGRRIRLDIDRAGPSGVGLDDCQRVSREIGAILEERDVVPGSYVLEVSSPGIDRPIKTADDVRRNTGRRVKVETTEPLDGRSSFRGVLAGLDGAALRLRDDDGAEISIPLAGIRLARQEVPF